MGLRTRATIKKHMSPNLWTKQDNSSKQASLKTGQLKQKQTKPDKNASKGAAPILTKNQYDLLTDKGDKVKVSYDSPKKKTRVPPITIFNQAPGEAVKALKDAEIIDFSLNIYAMV